jgi:hypothetical protein
VEGNICPSPDEECVFGPEGGRCTDLIFTDEECDNIDNDGDGLVDEVEDTVLTCYNGPPETMYEGLCQPGFQTCSYDKFEGVVWSECYMEIVPVAENGILACDGVDNDCDGCVDGVFAEGDVCGPVDPQEFDIVFMIDISGSMDDDIAAVQTAVDAFSAQFLGNDAFHFALILFPWPSGADVSIYDNPFTPELDGEFSEYSVFASGLATVGTGGGGSEGNWEAPYMLNTGMLSLSWRAGAQRLFILFTDENGQSPNLGIDEYDMCASFGGGDIFAAVVDPFYDLDFDCVFTGITPALVYYLTSDVTDMVDNLNEILGSPCE